MRHYANDGRQSKDTKRNKDGSIWYPRAGTLGGCTAHNAMIAIYGHASDWDHIAQLTGDPSWASDKMRAYFERLERCGYLPKPGAGQPNPSCASCHRMIDPAGLALENFDAVGAWRARDGGTRGTPIDASGQLVDGTQINGVNELRAALVRDPNVFVQALIERVLTYALGRGLTVADMPAVRAISRDAQRENYRFSAVVLGIVRSVPFQMRIKGGGEQPDRLASAKTDR